MSSRQNYGALVYDVVIVNVRLLEKGSLTKHFFGDFCCYDGRLRYSADIFLSPYGKLW